MSFFPTSCPHLPPIFLVGAAAAIIVYDITNPDSFAGAKSWVKELQRRGDTNVVIALVGVTLTFFFSSSFRRSIVARHPPPPHHHPSPTNSAPLHPSRPGTRPTLNPVAGSISTRRKRTPRRTAFSTWKRRPRIPTTCVRFSSR